MLPILRYLVMVGLLRTNHLMHNLYIKFAKILEICKQFSHHLVNDKGNISRRVSVPQFPDLEVVALSFVVESESIDSEKCFFDYKLQEYKSKIPNLISRQQFNDYRKRIANLCEAILKEIVEVMDDGENSKTSVDDRKFMEDVKRTYHDCNMYSDKGYIGADIQFDLFETTYMRLECPYRINQKNWKLIFILFAKTRKRIETFFSQLTGQFLTIRSYAKITNGLFARIIGKISALTVLQSITLMENLSVGLSTH